MILPSSDWEAFTKLQHHLDYFKAQKHPQGENTWENIQLIARAAKEYSALKEDMGRVEAMIGRVSVIQSMQLLIFEFKFRTLDCRSFGQLSTSPQGRSSPLPY